MNASHSVKLRPAAVIRSPERYGEIQHVRYLLGMAAVAPYLIGTIVVSVIIHYLTIRFVIRQMKVMGELSHDMDALEKELDALR